MKDNKPRVVKVVGWCSATLGLLAVLTGAGNIIAQYMNYGGIREYVALLQILLGGVTVGASVYMMKGKRIAREVLEGMLWLILLGSFGWAASHEAEFDNLWAMAMVQFWIPLGLLIYGVRRNAVRIYVDGT